ncbi:hypothetical protein PYCCODRAFT_1470472 [Trametes coccinea BRFM310]|uniref:MYND-type domain-containing protein n=1 Tax=Trametes coccinea (strain BRFM310) TaxID=1353009 RepID=A0A1Y2IDK6_TRAC3|nr:hypothetical protein PYCCODRAFT_1470472 [Trametes coccinea BRFM310]
MDRRMGAEATMGIGGGMVSKEAARNLEKAEDLCRRRKPEQALPYLFKAMEDPNCLDAAVQMAFLMPTMEMGIRLLEQAEARGRAHLKTYLSPTCFEDGDVYTGRFWSLLETRPYMRVLQAIVRLACEIKDYNKAANTIIEMLRLCPGDNLGQRDWLGSILLQAGRPADALSFAQAWLDRSRHDPDICCPPRGGCTFEPPSQAPLSQEFIEQNKGRAPGSMLYTAALASFKLWGDCVLSRQYLRLAASVNPHVLLKVLAKVEKPKSLNNSPRAFNGSEMAHDYLWLTQDLWMAADVWEWANSDTEVKSYVLKKCSREGCNNRELRAAEFKRCAGCREVVYCGPACQKADWKAHRKYCKDTQQQLAMIKAIMSGRSVQRSTDTPILASADFTSAGISTLFH